MSTSQCPFLCFGKSFGMGFTFDTNNKKNDDTSAKMPPNTRPIMIAIFVDFVLDIDDGPCKNGFPGRYLESLTNIICQMLN